MLTIFLYGIASLLLPAVIINANEPVINYSYLSNPTAVTPSFPVALGAGVFITGTNVTGVEPPSNYFGDLKSLLWTAGLSSLISSFARLSLYSSNNTYTRSALPWAWRGSWKMMMTSIASQRRTCQTMATTMTVVSPPSSPPSSSAGWVMGYNSNDHDQVSPERSMYSPRAGTLNEESGHSEDLTSVIAPFHSPATLWGSYRADLNRNKT
ncbi:hypothetical protein BCR41DRAFT_362308 [Lobosporangium transversale]|uniref:Uncharacterized protein n=1 Tax=Lobosporangium transversale TaxID=64571 RepID=A0A1Y2G9G3_9FUNG|nr:hypothetical protein BCR41DRAFT_362308 [Lobosporangium transversale]ORZ04831.1 hypothetical protein BCR41DRAFT_362308 [Lobosporangium transversale]|eukprot:XP_021876768.1 hypothetical protein BCR41DRAFT_362308 [Lobosporangium transversale]